LSRLKMQTENQAQQTVEGLYHDVERRIIASPPGLCPIDLTLSFMNLCHAQTCGKCVPCRIGLTQLQTLLNDVLGHRANMETFKLIEKTANSIMDSADCAIGYEAARMVIRGLEGFHDDYMSHILHGKCTYQLKQPVPCVALCPAGVDVPGYVALIQEGRCADAVRLIRKDNPFPVACAMVCEHPCEARCRRNMIDSPINIRGLKRYAVDGAGTVPVPQVAASTGKKIAIVGGGPSGLSAAYYLSLMGHKVVIYERENKLGGMLRYGIPSYRLPRERLQEDIDSILSTGAEVKLNVEIGKDVTFDELHKSYDAVYIAIGAQVDKKVGIPGEDSNGVISAVEMLNDIGNDKMPNMEGKEVVIIGAGNVAMDCTRSSLRLGAKKVTVVYRRQQADMPAAYEEIEDAMQEGCEFLTLKAPTRIEADADGNVCALWAKPQIIGPIDRWGRAKPRDAQAAEERIPCDRIIVAIGQGIDSSHFVEGGIPVHQGVFQATEDSEVVKFPGVFAGGDCVTGPATVIRAIAAGKVAAANIDEFLGFHHLIGCDVEIPEAKMKGKPPYGRVNMRAEEAMIRRNNFGEIERTMTDEEACQESGRCLRCDHFGYGALKGGRETRW